jgi:hypothetical protein
VTSRHASAGQIRLPWHLAVARRVEVCQPDADGEDGAPAAPAAPARLIVIACGARKADLPAAPAGRMYVGSYHRAARRAADRLATAGPAGARIMIVSAAYGLLDLAENITRYELRLGQPGSVTAANLRDQAEQRGLLDAGEVLVLAPAAYAALASEVWPYADNVLAGTRGIGDQMARLAALGQAAPS